MLSDIYTYNIFYIKYYKSQNCQFNKINDLTQICKMRKNENK